MQDSSGNRQATKVIHDSEVLTESKSPLSKHTMHSREAPISRADRSILIRPSTVSILLEASVRVLSLTALVPTLIPT